MYRVAGLRSSLVGGWPSSGVKRGTNATYPTPKAEQTVNLTMLGQKPAIFLVYHGKIVSYPNIGTDKPLRVTKSALDSAAYVKE
jgi:hypothetical protein